MRLTATVSFQYLSCYLIMSHDLSLCGEYAAGTSDGSESWRGAADSGEVGVNAGSRAATSLSPSAAAHRRSLSRISSGVLKRGSSTAATSLSPRAAAHRRSPCRCCACILMALRSGSLLWNARKEVPRPSSPVGLFLPSSAAHRHSRSVSKRGCSTAATSLERFL